MNKIELIKTILLTGICSLSFIAGGYLMVLTKERWERFMGRLISVSEMEMSMASFVVLKVIGLGLLGLSIFLIYRFFIYDPSAHMEQAWLAAVGYFLC